MDLERNPTCDGWDDLNPVPIAQQSPADLLAIEPGTIAAVEIFDLRNPALKDQPGMSSRNFRIVENNIAALDATQHQAIPNSLAISIGHLKK